MRSVLLFILLGCSLFSRAAGEPYAASAIPEALSKNAHVVKRMEELRFEIRSTTETVLHRKYALTILDENGDAAAGFSEYYDKLSKITSIEGALYDAEGKLLKKVRSKDVQDLSAVDGNNLMDDNRVRIHDFHYRQYPYTVAYEVEVRHNNSLFFPRWLPQEDEAFSVEQSRITVVAPAGYTVRYKAFNYKEAPVAAVEKSGKTLTWEVRNMPPLKMQYAMPPFHEITTMVFLAPTGFEIEGYKGNMSSWQEFGRFVYALQKDRDGLPENIRHKVKELTAGLTDERAKVKALYEFLQKNTRYISIQLGIGGWQPFEASYVSQKGYGDCKALTNYMYSLLKEAGIRSHYTLVKAGSNKTVLEDFPSQQFNHVILSVPQPKDTIWLECTSQTLPFNYVSDFTSNRKALVIDENGGKLVATPRYGLKENLQLRAIHGKLDEKGNMTTSVRTRYAAEQQDNLQMVLTSLTKDRVKKRLQEGLSLATYEVDQFRYEEKREQLPEISEQLDLFISGYATITGKRLFIVPNLLNRSGRQLAEEARAYDLQIGPDYRDVDSVAIELPEGYTPEQLPKEVRLKTPFGSYSSSVKLEGNKLIYYREREQYAGRFPAKDYSALSKFYAGIYKADRSRVVLVKKD